MTPASVRSTALPVTDGPAAGRAALAAGQSARDVLGVLLLMPINAGVCIASVQIYLGQGVRLLPAVMVAALALAGYALNRLTDGAEDRRNDPLGAPARRRFGMALLVLAGTTIVAAGLALAVRGRHQPIYGALLLVGVLYSCPLVPAYRRGRATLLRLKAVPALKNLTIAATWSASVFLVPALDGGVSRTQLARFLMLASGYGWMIWLNSFFCDLRDAAGDRDAGVTTLAAQLGPGRAYRLVTLGTVAWTAYLAGVYTSSYWLDAPHFLFLAAAAIGYPAVVVMARERLRQSRGWTDLLVESSDLLYAAGLLTLAWIR